VIEYTRGHDLLAFSDFSKTKERKKSCPLFIFSPGPHAREEPEKRSGVGPPGGCISFVSLLGTCLVRGFDQMFRLWLAVVRRDTT
jgi:hypothetical protein